MITLLIVALNIFLGAGWQLAYAVNTPIFRLPYQDGDSFVVSRGYNTPSTHIKKDAYAIDFAQEHCDAYGRPVVASSGGNILLAQAIGYNGGYGTQILIDHGHNIITRYAHMISESFAWQTGDVVVQGVVIGEVGDTGEVQGNTCLEHPGTHLHFAAYEKNHDGTYAALDPEPISGFENIRKGKWYRAGEGVIAGVKSVAMPEKPQVISPALETSVVPLAATEDLTASRSPQSTSVAEKSTSQTTTSSINGYPMPFTSPGGVSIYPAPGGVAAQNALPPPPSDPSSTPVAQMFLGPIMPIPNNDVFALFNTSTFVLDFAWQEPTRASGSIVYAITESSATTPTWTGTSTSVSIPTGPNGSHYEFTLKATDEEGRLATTSVAITVPNWTAVVQSNADSGSYVSWYDDNWYQLGTGFSGTIRSLTLNGYSGTPPGFKSHLSLDEFLDPAYTIWNQNFVISDDAPFTATSTFVTIDNLNIRLQSNKYYRLATYEDKQNMSVGLRGTTATGTMMSNAFVPGIGRVEFQHQFYPYLAWTFIPDWPPLLPPNQPSDFRVAFDPANVQLNVSWGVATDPDTTSSLLTYEYAVTTSSVPTESDWHNVGKDLEVDGVPVSYPNNYEVAVRVRDDLNNVSKPVGVSWGFPDGFFPLPSQQDHSGGTASDKQHIHLDGPVRLAGVNLWTEWQYGIYKYSQSYLSWHRDASGTLGELLGTSEPAYATVAPQMETSYVFDVPFDLAPGDYWFTVSRGPAVTTNGTTFYGNGTDFYYRLRTRP